MSSRFHLRAVRRKKSAACAARARAGKRLARRRDGLRAHCWHSFKALRDVYAQDKEIEGEDFRHRNWFRSEKTLIALGAQLNDLLQLYGDEMQKFRF
jgi:hypothetical protein